MTNKIVKSLGQIFHETYEETYREIEPLSSEPSAYDEFGPATCIANEAAALAVVREYLARKLKEGYVWRLLPSEAPELPDNKELVRLAKEQYALVAFIKDLAPHAAIRVMVGLLNDHGDERFGPQYAAR